MFVLIGVAFNVGRVRDKRYTLCPFLNPPDLETILARIETRSVLAQYGASAGLAG